MMKIKIYTGGEMRIVNEVHIAICNIEAVEPAFRDDTRIRMTSGKVYLVEKPIKDILYNIKMIKSNGGA